VVEYATNPDKRQKSDAQLAKEAKKTSSGYAQSGRRKGLALLPEVGKDYARSCWRRSRAVHAQGKFADKHQGLPRADQAKRDHQAVQLQAEILRNLSMTGSRASRRPSRTAAAVGGDEKTTSMQGIRRKWSTSAGTTPPACFGAATSAQEAQRRRDGTTRSSTCTKYIRRFRKEKDAYKMHYWYGELLFKLRSLTEPAATGTAPAPVYTDVVKMDPRAQAQGPAYARSSPGRTAWMWVDERAGEGTEAEA